LAKQPIAGDPEDLHERWGLHNDWRGWWKKLFMPVVADVRSALAASPALAFPVPSDAGVMGLDVDALAQEIRRVDGRHDLGAGALAEALLPFIRSCLVPSGGKDQEAVAGEHDRADALCLRGFIKEEGMTPSMMASKARIAEAALDAERAAHEETKEKLVDAIAAFAALGVEKEVLSKAYKDERARSALLEETVEAQRKGQLARLEGAFMAGRNSTSGTDRHYAGRAWQNYAARLPASLTQHKAPALPASDAEGGANG
jgi:hypothetical protein